MNNNPFGNVTFPEFILAEQDANDNLFMRNEQNPNQNQMINGLLGDSNREYVTFPGTLNAQNVSIPSVDEPVLFNLDIDALNRGFAEAECNSMGVPSYDMGRTPMHDGRPPALLNVSLASGNTPMQSDLIVGYDIPAQNMPENFSKMKSNVSFNPYADYLANLQQANYNVVGNVPEANMLGPITGVPNSVQNESKFLTPIQMNNMPGKMYPAVLSGMRGLLPKKKSMKATAYDIMSDFIERIPMFTHKQEIYIYDRQNGYYRCTPQYEVEQIIMDLYRPIIKEYGSGTLIEKVYKLLLKEPYIVRNEIPLSDPTKISFANCTVDIQNQTMTLHSPVNMVTHAMTCNLARFNHASEDCPVFDKFLHDISGGDSVLEKLIWEIIGYCLTPDISAKKFFVFQGVRDSGKSLLCNLLSDFYPEDKVSALSVHSLQEKFAKGNLHRYMLCVSPDLPTAPLDSTSTSVIKQITGNDKISAPVKYKNNVQFRFEGKLILASNYPLLTEVPDDAFMQRAIVVPFLHTIPKESQDANLLAKMKAEKPAIASKALDAYFQLRKNHYQFSGNYEMNASVLYPDNLLDTPEITLLVYNFLLNSFEKDPDGLVAIESAFDVFVQEVSDQFTEKIFSSVFRRLAEEIYGANRIRSYHGGKYENARSTIKGIRFKQYN